MLNMYKTRYCNVINDPYLVLILTVTFDLKFKKKKKRKQEEQKKNNNNFKKTSRKLLELN